MLNITAKGEDRIDLELEGQVDSDEMKSGLDDLIEKSADLSNGKMLYRVSNLQSPTFGALVVELSRLPKLFGLVGKFSRIAVLADTEWLQHVSEWKGNLFPGMEIKAFDLHELSEAEAWLEG